MYKANQKNEMKKNEAIEAKKRAIQFIIKKLLSKPAK